MPCSNMRSNVSRSSNQVSKTGRNWMATWRESKGCLITGCLNSTEVPKVGIPKPDIPKSGIPKTGTPKTGIPKVGQTHTGTFPETEISKARDSEVGDSEDRDSESRDSEDRASESRGIPKLGDSENGQIQGPLNPDPPSLSFLSLFFFLGGGEKTKENQKNKDFLSLYAHRTPKFPGKEGENDEKKKNKEILAKEKKKNKEFQKKNQGKEGQGSGPLTEQHCPSQNHPILYT